jgi:hypothetical protein
VYPLTVQQPAADSEQRTFTIVVSDPEIGTPCTREYELVHVQHAAYQDLFESIAGDFGTRVPLNRQTSPASSAHVPYQALLTESVAPQILYGYGDPAVIRVEPPDGTQDPTWYLLVTSNDAPHAFPILRTRNLKEWSFVSSVFPEGHKPAWAADGRNASDFWAPEMHYVEGEFRVYFTAREKGTGELALGMARAAHPEGPFVSSEQPILGGGVIDPHLLVGAEGDAFLLWKRDANDLWPTQLMELLSEHGELIAQLFPSEQDQRTACLLQSLWPWVKSLNPMERFFIQQTFIEAVTTDFTAFRQRLVSLADHQANSGVGTLVAAMLEAMRTPIFAQRLARDGKTLIGEPSLVLENDLDWEAHLVEGPWVAQHDSKYYMFYAGNDFSTARYGIGVAIAERPLGPYRKVEGPLFRSTAEWVGPGHPSIALGSDGKPQLFLHAFYPGKTGYKEFRVLLTVPIAFEHDRVVVRNV